MLHHYTFNYVLLPIESIAGPPSEYNIFKKHYFDLTKLLYLTDLTAQLIQAGVLVPENHQNIDTKDTMEKKATFVLEKVQNALETGFTESFYKMLQIMKYYGSDATQSLSVTIECEIHGKGLFCFQYLQAHFAVQVYNIRTAI